MNKSTRNTLIGAGIASSAIAAFGAVSHTVTKKLKSRKGVYQSDRAGRKSVHRRAYRRKRRCIIGKEYKRDGGRAGRLG